LPTDLRIDAENLTTEDREGQHRNVRTRSVLKNSWRAVELKAWVGDEVEVRMPINDATTAETI
jgi:hypothetical protein